MVMTTSLAWTASVVSTFGVYSEMSMPTSRMASTTAGSTCSAGRLPAERTSTAPAARAVRKPAAIWERPALCTQTNSTVGVSDMGRPSRCGGVRTGPARTGRGRSGPVRGCGGGHELGEQGVDAGVDVVTDPADLGEWAVLRVGQVPVEVPLAGIDRAGIPASHGDHHVGGLHDVVGERLGEGPGQVQPELAHHLDHGGFQLPGADGAGGADVHPPAGAGGCTS